MKLLNMHSVALVSALGLVLAGCGSSSSSPPSADSGVTDAGGLTDGGVVDAGGGDGGLAACESQVLTNQPSTPQACAQCLCTNCASELDTCNTTTGCNDLLACASDCCSLSSTSNNQLLCGTTNCASQAQAAGGAGIAAAQAVGTCTTNNCAQACARAPAQSCSCPSAGASAGTSDICH